MRTNLKPDYPAFIEKHFDPKLTDREIAERILNDKLWNHNVNYGRSLVGIYRKFGSKYNRDKGLSPTETVRNSFEFFKEFFPKSTLEEYSPFILPEKHKEILLLCDVHNPEFAEREFAIAVDYGLKNGIDTVYLNGDFMDCYAIGRWQTDPKKRNFGQEIEIGRKMFTGLRQVFPNQYIFWKEGNHEDRWKSYLYGNASDLAGIDSFQLQNIFNLGAHGIELIGSKKICYAGGLNIIHGHELPKGMAAPVNAARGVYLRSKCSTITGHFHQTSEHTEKDIRNHITTCWTVGCLSDLNPDYATVNKYNHGFAHISMLGGGRFKVRNYRIINGEIY